jgi:hypothetical protein
MPHSIFVNLDDDVRQITRKISQYKSGEVVLVVPQGSRIFLDSLNLRIILKHAHQLGVKVFLQTRDERGLKYAEQNNIPVMPAYPAGSQVKHQANVVKKPELPITEPVKPTIKHASPILHTKKPILQSTNYKNPRDDRQENHQAFEEVFISHQNSSGQTNAQLLDHARRVGETKKRWPQILVFLFVLFSLSILAALYFYVLPEGDISIYPKTESLSRSLEISGNARVKDLDESHLTVPATSVEQTYEKTMTMSSTGKKEVGTPSRGQVVIYNLTGNPISLKKATTVLSIGNRNYYLDADQDNIKSIPARQANDPKANLPDPISVVSQDGGKIGNQPAGIRMEITNQVFGSRPQTLYAKTVTAIDGGESRFLSVVSNDDITNAQQTLKNAILEDIKQDLNAEGLVLPDGAYQIDVLSFSTDKDAGTESVNFDAHISARVKLLSVSKAQVQKIVRNRILSGLTQGEFLQDDSKDSIEIKVKNLDLENKSLSLLVDYSTTAFFKVNQKDLSVNFAGKSVGFVQDYYLNNPQIDKVEIELKPSWQRKLPQFSKKIFIKVITPE